MIGELISLNPGSHNDHTQQNYSQLGARLVAVQVVNNEVVPPIVPQIIYNSAI